LYSCASKASKLGTVFFLWGIYGRDVLAEAVYSVAVTYAARVRVYEHTSFRHAVHCLVYYVWLPHPVPAWEKWRRGKKKNQKKKFIMCGLKSSK
jgi:hypothetical protein